MSYVMYVWSTRGMRLHAMGRREWSRAGRAFRINFLSDSLSRAIGWEDQRRDVAAIAPRTREPANDTHKEYTYICMYVNVCMLNVVYVYRIYQPCVKLRTDRWWFLLCITAHDSDDLIVMLIVWLAALPRIYALSTNVYIYSNIYHIYSHWTYIHICSHKYTRTRMRDKTRESLSAHIRTSAARMMRIFQVGIFVFRLSFTYNSQQNMYSLLDARVVNCRHLYNCWGHEILIYTRKTASQQPATNTWRNRWMIPH